MSNRLAIILPSLAIGGAEKSLIILANKFVNNNWMIDLIVLSSDGPLLDLIDPKINVVCLQEKRFRNAIIPLTKYIKSRQPNIVLSSMYGTAILMVACQFLSRQKFISVVGIHSDINEEISNANNFKDLIFLKFLTPIFLRYANAFIGVSTSVTLSFSKFISAPDDIFYVAYNPIVDENVVPNRISQNDSNYDTEITKGKIVCSVGRLVRQKDFHTLIKAFRLVKDRISDASLVIVGDGPLRECLEELAFDLQLGDDVHFKGWHEEPTTVIKGCDLFVMSSISEGFGNTLVEALSCGVEVIATDCDFGPRETLCNGKFGALVPVGDVAAMAQAIETNLSIKHTSQKRKTELIARSLDFSYQKSFQRYSEIFDELMSSST